MLDMFEFQGSSSFTNTLQCSLAGNQAQLILAEHEEAQHVTCLSYAAVIYMHSTCPNMCLIAAQQRHTASVASWKPAVTAHWAPVLPAGDGFAALPLHAISRLTQLTQLRLHCSCSPQQLHTLCSTLTRLQHLELGSAAAAVGSTACNAVFGCSTPQHNNNSSSFNRQLRVACSNPGATAGPDGLSAVGWMHSTLQHLTLKDGCITAAGGPAAAACALTSATQGVGVLPALAVAGVLCCCLPLLPQLSELTSLCLLPADGCGAMLSK